MDLLDTAHDERAIRAGTAEQRDIVARSRHDITAADELAATASP